MLETHSRLSDIIPLNRSAPVPGRSNVVMFQSRACSKRLALPNCCARRRAHSGHRFAESFRDPAVVKLVRSVSQN